MKPLLKDPLTKVVFFRNHPNPPYSVIFFVPMKLITIDKVTEENLIELTDVQDAEKVAV